MELQQAIGLAQEAATSDGLTIRPVGWERDGTFILCTEEPGDGVIGTFRYVRVNPDGSTQLCTFTMVIDEIHDMTRFGD